MASTDRTLPDSLRFEAEAKRLWLFIPSRAEKFAEGEAIIERALREAAAKALEWALNEATDTVRDINAGAGNLAHASPIGLQNLHDAIKALRSEGTKEGG